ncbi:ISAs1 family transposase [Streptomyces sp. NBC_01264]|uniref:ISAs1 family transposase n=1 Tax=Streptomyces sp. NBC_01264 TaxID=2903804 RepID=UPI00225BF31B|nr:ISAs1 family transposase [Streptomyces sp. NBC_01264]MCX4775271.1 ISAs1 family transposase [Streptomyces sp. NBC_01264]MCX4778705.1 ISAs1 family transposase [Streptomyces sp. NBC_01264]MCX4783607.1 ISAs1 family transposase [Streptomyces sp. NBC_01264]MCX4784214.1 ISAs1 family transposase [Streptomyces sp. NBC_01264]MCX4784367.1 ISAs1 family transposase [Streptomyces sp. NBC_01264]
MLVRLGPLDADRVADLRPYFDAVPDPRSLRGRWYSLTAVLLVCACAVVSGARSIDELAEWGQRASDTLLTVIGIRRHLLGWRRAPSPATIGRVLGAVDGDVLDRAVGAYLADRHRAATEPTRTPPSASERLRVIAVDGKALKGSARLTAKRRHLLSAVTHGTVVTIAQVEVGAKTNETTHFQPLLTPLDLAGTVVTFDALHSVRANITWLVETKKAHYIAVIKTNQPTAHRQLASLPWRDISIQHTASATGHGRRESRSVKTCAVPDQLGGIAFPHARLAIRIHRRRKQTGQRETRESVYAVTSLDAHQATPADLAAAIRGHWGIENSSHHTRDVTFAEDASTVHTRTAPRAMATLRNLAIGALKTLGAANIAKTTRAIRHEPQRALGILGITHDPDTHGT